MVPQSLRSAAFSVAALVACLWAFAPPAFAADSGDAKLTSEPMADPAAMLTPAKVHQAAPVQICKGPTGQITIGGKSVAVAAAANNLFGLDLNGDGKVDAREMGPVPAAEAVAKFTIKDANGDPKKSTLVVFSDFRIYSANNAITFVYARFYAGSWLRGTVNGVPIRIVDENLDGKITQDGQDAIFIGDSTCAMPLLNVHRIGNADYELKVSPDGATVGYTKVADEKLGQVDAPLLKSPSLQSLILADSAKGQAYDLATSKGGIPAGDYKFVYAVIHSGKDPLLVVPTAKTPTYTTQADATNTLRLGPPLHLGFKATVDGNNTLTIFPAIAVLGSGAEEYRVDFHGSARPEIALIAGSTVLSHEPMGFG